MIDNLFEHIEKAREEAFRNFIKINTIIIDEDLARINNLYFSYGMRMGQIRPSILGLNVIYSKNLAKDYDYNFMLTDKPEPVIEKNLSDYSTEELLEEIRRRTK